MRDDVRVMLAPFATYRRQLAERRGPGPFTACARPMLVALVIGALVTLGHGGELLPTLLLGSVLAFLWVPLLQLVLVTPLVALCRPAPVSWPRAVDLFFLSHGPWSFWLLAVAGFVLVRPPSGLAGLAGTAWLAPSALLPTAWTAFILFAYGRTVLALSPVRSILFLAVYEAAIGACVYLLVGLATYRLSPFSLNPSYWP